MSGAVKGLPDQASLQTEYCEIGQNMRFYSDTRFKWFTLFVAQTSALGGAAFQFEQSRGICAGVGMLLGLAFVVFEIRSVTYWSHFLRRGQEIEEQLGFSQYRGLPRARVLRATNAMLAIYIGAIPLWAVILKVL